MRALFIHQNFPGQYSHIVRHLRANRHIVYAISQRPTARIEGVGLISYAPPQPGHGAQTMLHETEAAFANGVAVARECQQLAREGFKPDLIVGHNGWGEILFVKDVWPDVPLLGYFEFFYRRVGADVGFDPEFSVEDDIALRLRIRNAVNLLGLDAVDWGQTPTVWQRDQYPAIHHGRLSVVHEGVDSDVARPEPLARVWLSGGLTFASGDEVLTYVSRSLEPYRGFHVFMRALPRVLAQRPNAHVVIVGDDGVSYGRPPPRFDNWRSFMLAELDGRLDHTRVHFLGTLPVAQYLALLQISAAHCYLTYPFVLSWSFLEAMSAGCLVVGSRTPPVEEVIVDGYNGRLVDFFDVDRLAETIIEVLGNRAGQTELRAAARQTVLDRYDLKTKCLPQYLALLSSLVSGGTPSSAISVADATEERPLLP